MVDQIISLWDSHLMKPVIALGIAFAFFTFSQFFNLYIFKLVIRFTEKTKTSLDTKIAVAFRKPVKNFIMFLGIFIGFRYLSLPSEYNDLVLRLFRSTVIILITAGFYNLSSTTSALFNKLNKSLDFEIDKILIPII